MAAEDSQSGSSPLTPILSPGEQADAPESSESPTLSVTAYWNLLQKTRVIDTDMEARVADKPFRSSNPKVWGVLTALSNRARKRKQGLNMFLKEDVHFMGGLVEDYQFRIDTPFVSRVHCKIYRQTFASEDDALNSQPLVFLKDISCNGTYVNGIRYTRRDEAVQIHHGDLISFVGRLGEGVSFTFMYREALKADVSSNGVLGKRKAPAEEVGCEVGISVDDFHSLQRSNSELRKKLEDRGLTIDKLQNENRASMLHHHQSVSQKRSFSETTTTEVMDDSSRWGESEAGNWLMSISNDEDEDEDFRSDEPPIDEESMNSCPDSEEDEDEDDDDEEEEKHWWCREDSNTVKMNYNDNDSEESGEEVVSEYLNLKIQRSKKKLSDDERNFGFDSDGLLIIESEFELESAIKEELLVKQEDEDEEQERVNQ